MKHTKTVAVFLIISTLSYNTASAKRFSFKKLSGLFSRKSHEEVINKEYALNEHGVLNIENPCGNIHIKSEWNQNKVFLKAVKKAPKAEMLGNIQLIDNHAPNDHITLKTSFADGTTKGSMDFLLIVPTDIDLHLSTDKGNIKIEQAKGSIWAITENGNVEILDSKKAVTAVAKKSGSISIFHPQGKVKATTNSGDIVVQGTRNSVLAKAKKGKIHVDCTEIPDQSTIALATKSGHLELALPKEIHASIRAKTCKGQITCDHMITLKEKTTTLDRASWKRFKQEVNGTLGEGKANILLSAASGNIKISEAKEAKA